MNLARQILWIGLCGTVLAWAANAVSPRGIPWSGPPPRVVHAGDTITREAAHEAWRRGAAVFIDAREPADYAAGHIGNALNLPARSVAEHFDALLPVLGSGAELVIYCDGKDCDLSRELADVLRSRGYPLCRILENGWTVWREAGLPTTRGARP